ncbi:MAG: hypothetical protein IPO27_00200 [Bacteroidetes bacterium]|nr:hypothetical protein [Bacteroidota bacterium]
MGIYKVTAFNTPQFNDKLHAASLEYFPEVHCYLKLSNHRFDFTTHSSNIAKIEGDII